MSNFLEKYRDHLIIIDQYLGSLSSEYFHFPQARIALNLNPARTADEGPTVLLGFADPRVVMDLLDGNIWK